MSGNRIELEKSKKRDRKVGKLLTWSKITLIGHHQCRKETKLLSVFLLSCFCSLVDSIATNEGGRCVNWTLNGQEAIDTMQALIAMEIYADGLCNAIDGRRREWVDLHQYSREIN